MNIINPQSTPQNVQRSEMQGGERADAKSNTVVDSGKVLPQLEAKGVPEAKETDTNRQLAQAVAKLNDYIQSVQRDLRFSLDESSGESVITVVDRHSSEVIRRIPAEVTLLLAQKLNNEEPLLLFSAQV
jgi:flagellar protein FlaG